MNRIFFNQQACDVMFKTMKKHGLDDLKVSEIFRDASWAVDPMALDLEKTIEAQKPKMVAEKKPSPQENKCFFCLGKDHRLPQCPLQAHKHFFDGYSVHAIPGEPQAYLLAVDELPSPFHGQMVFVLPKGMFPIVVGLSYGNPFLHLITLKQTVSKLDLKTFENIYECPVEWLTLSLCSDIAMKDPALWVRINHAGLSPLVPK